MVFTDFWISGSSSSKFISTTPEAWLRRIREPFPRLGQFRRSAPAKDQPQFSSANYCRSRPNQTMFENEKAQARLSLRGIWRNAASDWCELKNFSCHGSEENRRKHWRPQLCANGQGHIFQDQTGHEMTRRPIRSDPYMLILTGAGKASLNGRKAEECRPYVLRTCTVSHLVGR